MFVFCCFVSWWCFYSYIVLDLSTLRWSLSPVCRQLSHVIKSDIWPMPPSGLVPRQKMSWWLHCWNVASDIHSQFRAHTVNSVLWAVYQFSLILIYVLTLCEIHDLPRIRENPILSETTKIAIHEYQWIHSSIARF